MITTICLMILISLDVGYECVAHFIYHNGKIKTASWVIRHFEGKNLWKRALVTITLVVLGWLHLVGYVF